MLVERFQCGLVLHIRPDAIEFDNISITQRSGEALHQLPTQTGIGVLVVHGALGKPKLLFENQFIRVAQPKAQLIRIP